MFLNLKRGTFYTLLIVATLLSYQVAFAVSDPVQEKPSDNQQKEELEQPKQESDSIESQPVSSFSGEELLDIKEPGTDSGNLPENDSFYEADEEEDNSQSVISFNFLYYLLQKFKFTESLLY